MPVPSRSSATPLSRSTRWSNGLPTGLGLGDLCWRARHILKPVMGDIDEAACATTQDAAARGHRYPSPPAGPGSFQAVRRTFTGRAHTLLSGCRCRGGAVGVHSTQFEIHDPASGLLRPVLALAAEVVEQELQVRPRPFAIRRSTWCVRSSMPAGLPRLPCTPATTTASGSIC